MESSKPDALTRGTRVLIVDDDALFRRGVREHLEARGVDVVGEAEDEERTVALAAATSPDVVLMNSKLQGASSADPIKRLCAAAPGTRVLIMTDSADLDVVEPISAGACGFLLKYEEGDRILAAIAAAARGESPVSPTIASTLIRRVRDQRTPAAGREAPVLTVRERQVLDLIVEGKDNNEIAAQLVISPETVKSHVSAILEKLQVENRVQAAVAAVRAGIV